jgi:hypothetical protein
VPDQLRACPLLFTVSVLLATGCGVESKPATRDVFIWRSVGSWTGRGPLQTESFIGETGSLRVRWETRHETVPGGGKLQVTVHSAISGRPLAVAVDHRGVGKDSAYVSEDPRVFYLVVESANIEWSITVDDGIAATTSRAQGRNW